MYFGEPFRIAMDSSLLDGPLVVMGYVTKT